MKRSGASNEHSGTSHHPPPFSDPPSSHGSGGRGGRKRKKRQRQLKKQQVQEEAVTGTAAKTPPSKDWGSKRKLTFPSLFVLQLSQQIQVCLCVCVRGGSVGDGWVWERLCRRGDEVHWSDRDTYHILFSTQKYKAQLKEYIVSDVIDCFPL